MKERNNPTTYYPYLIPAFQLCGRSPVSMSVRFPVLSDTSLFPALGLWDELGDVLRVEWEGQSRESIILSKGGDSLRGWSP
jgi:hypothetical protein